MISIAKPILFLALGTALLGPSLEASPRFKDNLPAQANVRDQDWKTLGTGADPKAPREFFVYRAGANGAYDSFALDESSVVVRHRLKIDMVGEGTAPFLTWGELHLGLSHIENFLAINVWDRKQNGWIDSGFVLELSGDTDWFDLDIAKVELPDYSYDMVFANGSLIASLPCTDSSVATEYFIFQNKFSEISISKGKQSPDYPGYVLRGLRKLGFSTEEIMEKLDVARTERTPEPFPRLEVPSDDIRKLRNGSPHITVHSGDLTLEEEAWFMTQTVNRTFFEYVEVSDIADLPLIESSLTPVRSDYLPTLESRSWDGSYSYSNSGDHHVEKLYGLLMVEESGEYTFHLSGDEKAILLLSEDSSLSKLYEVARLETSTAQVDYSKSKGVPVYLEAYHPVYFEVWHIGTTANDRLSVGWYSASEKKVIPIPSSSITSFHGGVPGSLNRNFIIKDPTQLTCLDEIDSLSKSVTTGMSLAGPWDQIDGTLPILVADFSANNYRYHAYGSGDAGLGWLFANHSNWPWMFDLDESSVVGLGWLWYMEATSNPQRFYDNDLAKWFDYYHLPYPRIWYDGVALPVKWDFNDPVTVNWDQAASPDDDDNWTFSSNPTPSSGTGPGGDRDFLLGGPKGRYAFLETSSPKPAYTAGKKAFLISPFIYVEPDNTTLHLYYHMYGLDSGILQVDIWSNGAWTNNVWSVSGQQQTSTNSPYLRADIPITSAFADRLIRIRIRGIAAGGWRGDIAFDDVILYVNDADSDGDGLTDQSELLTFGTNPLSWDSDGDGLSDAEEVFIFFSNPLDRNSNSVGTGYGSIIVF